MYCVCSECSQALLAAGCDGCAFRLVLQPFQIEIKKKCTNVPEGKELVAHVMMEKNAKTQYIYHPPPSKKTQTTQGEETWYVVPLPKRYIIPRITTAPNYKVKGLRTSLL